MSEIVNLVAICIEITRLHLMLTEKHGDSSNLCYSLNTQADFFVPITISSARGLLLKTLGQNSTTDVENLSNLCRSRHRQEHCD